MTNTLPATIIDTLNSILDEACSRRERLEHEEELRLLFTLNGRIAMAHRNDDPVGVKDTQAAPETSVPIKVAWKPNIGAGRRAVTISFAVISLLGVLFIFGYWASIDLSIALQRCVGFVAIMGGVHFVGYRMWRRQFASSESEPIPNSASATPQPWRTPTSIILMVVGTLFLLLLNGQVFTNSLVFLFCWAMSLAIRLTDPMLRTRRSGHLVWPLFVILLHVVFITLVVLSLPSGYAFQESFNRR